MTTRILDNAERIHFYENDRNSPEDICFPSCMTSLAGSIGIDVERIVTPDGWTKRILYISLLAWTGMGWGLLWEKSGCLSCMDLTQVNDSCDETIQLGFEGIGCRAEIIENNDGTAELIRSRIVDSIDRGIPVVAFGLVDPPEAGLVCGYGDGGRQLLGWDMFQKEFPVETAPNGMLLLKDWRKVHKFAFLKERGPAFDLRSPEALNRCLRRGIAIMEKNTSQGYLAGQAAYAAWQDYTLAEGVSADEARKRHFTVHVLTGNHAEARAFTCGYLSENPAFPEEVRAAGRGFGHIHDLCWKVWGVLGKYGEPMDELAEQFTLPENRRQMAEIIGEMAAVEADTLRQLKQFTGE